MLSTQPELRDRLEKEGFIHYMVGMSVEGMSIDKVFHHCMRKPLVEGFQSGLSDDDAFDRSVRQSIANDIANGLWSNPEKGERLGWRPSPRQLGWRPPHSRERLLCLETFYKRRVYTQLRKRKWLKKFLSDEGMIDYLVGINIDGYSNDEVFAYCVRRAVTDGFENGLYRECEEDEDPSRRQRFQPRMPFLSYLSQ